jgi:hypothetical protein
MADGRLAELTQIGGRFECPWEYLTYEMHRFQTQYYRLEKIEG